MGSPLACRPHWPWLVWRGPTTTKNHPKTEIAAEKLAASETTAAANLITVAAAGARATAPRRIAGGQVIDIMQGGQHGTAPIGPLPTRVGITTHRRAPAGAQGIGLRATTGIMVTTDIMHIMAITRTAATMPLMVTAPMPRAPADLPPIAVRAPVRAPARQRITVVHRANMDAITALQPARTNTAVVRRDHPRVPRVLVLNEGAGISRPPRSTAELAAVKRALMPVSTGSAPRSKACGESCIVN